MTERLSNDIAKRKRNMKKTFIVIFFLISAVSLFSNENYVVERNSFLLRLSIDEEQYWEFTVPQSPYIINETYIQFYPGEEIYIEAEVEDDKIIKLSVVKEITDADKTIVVEFNQITDNNDDRIHNFMMLKINNPFHKDMEYKADIYLVEYNRWTNTSIIPVRAGLLSYESWPDVIGTIVLHDFVLK